MNGIVIACYGLLAAVWTAAVAVVLAENARHRGRST